MTNREHLNNLSNEEFAKWIINEFGGSEQDLLDFIKWLNEEPLWVFVNENK